MRASLGWMARGVALACAVLAYSTFIGCGDDDETPLPDAGRIDGGGFDGGAPDGGPVRGPTAPPSLPVFTPCPDGWREVSSTSAYEPTVCDPWPESGRATCAAGEIHLPGTAGCESIAGACPSSGFPDDLPSDGDVLFVRAGAVAGDGSELAPYASIGEAVAVATDGATIAIAPGLYTEDVLVAKPLSLRGACGDVVVRGANHAGTLFVTGASPVLIDRLTIEGAEGIWVTDSEVTLDSVEVRSVAGVCVRSASSVVTGQRLGLRDCAAALAPADGTIDVRDVEIDHARTDPFRPAGGLLRVTNASVHDSVEAGEILFASRGTAELRRIVVETEVAQDLIVIGAGTSVALEDFVFRGPAPATPTPPMTFIAFGESSLSLSRVRLERMRSLGLAVADAGTTLTASDVLIRDVLADRDSAIGAGHGFEVGGGALAEVDRMAIARARGFSVIVDALGSAMNARDMVVSGTLPDEMGSYGRALQIQRGATATIERGAFIDSREVAVVVAGFETTATLRDVLVDTIAKTECTEPCTSAGIGIGAYIDGRVDVARFRVRGAPLAGIQIAVRGEVDLVDGEVIDNLIGANVQVPGYDVGRLTARVSYDNETNLDATSLPVPEATTPGP